MKPLDIKFKDAEIAWCWDIFDQIITELDRNLPSRDLMNTIRYLSNLGLKGRQDSRED